MIKQMSSEIRREHAISRFKDNNATPMLNERCRQVHIGDTHIDPGHYKSYMFQLNDVASLFNFLVHIYTPTHD